MAHLVLYKTGKGNKEGKFTEIGHFKKCAANKGDKEKSKVKECKENNEGKENQEKRRQKISGDP